MAINIQPLPLGFGTAVSNFLDQSQGDYVFKEIRASSGRVEIRKVRVELDAGAYIRAAGDATANGGLIIVGRVGILRGPQGRVPPGFGVTSSGDTPNGYLPAQLQGFDFLWQFTVQAWGDRDTERFDAGEMFALGDKSLYVIAGGLRRIIAGTNAVPGAGSDAPILPVTMSVTGVDFGFNPNQQTTSGFASLPRYDVPIP